MVSGGSVTVTQQQNRSAGASRLRRCLSLLPTAVGLLLLSLALLLPGSALVRAQTDTFAVGSTVQVASTDGEPLDLRSGPSSDGVVVARLAPDETVTVIAAAQVVGTTRWIPIKTASGQLGWVAEQYLATPN